MQHGTTFFILLAYVGTTVALKRVYNGSNTQRLKRRLAEIAKTSNLRRMPLGSDIPEDLTAQNVSGQETTEHNELTRSNIKVQDALNTPQEVIAEVHHKQLTEVPHQLRRTAVFGNGETNIGVDEKNLPDNLLDSEDLLDDTTLNNVMHALMLSYVVTTGTYSKKAFIEKTSQPGKRILLQTGFPVGVVGWKRRLDLDRNPAEGVNGVHGIVLTNEFMQAIIVIRGTDLPRQDADCKEESGCRADLCAGKKLWDLPVHVISTMDIPLWCGHKSAEHDYIGEAIEFVSQALTGLEGYQVLLAGHSLGAGLAILAGADILGKASLGLGTTVHVVAISPPPFASHLGEKQLDKRFILIYNDLDPTLWATQYRGGFQGADPLCYDAEAINADAIRACVEDCIPAVEWGMPPAEFGTIWATGKCDLCYPETHELRPYLKASRGFKKLQKCSFALPKYDRDEDINAVWLDRLEAPARAEWEKQKEMVTAT